MIRQDDPREGESLPARPMRPLFCWVALLLGSAYVTLSLGLIVLAAARIAEFRWWVLALLPVAYAAIGHAAFLIGEARGGLWHHRSQR